MQATVAFLHTHVLVIVLFLILFTFKTALLLLNKRETLAKARTYTKALDTVFGLLILVTGGYLLANYQGIPTWLVFKIALVLAAIPIGIIGIRKENKVMAVLSLLLFFYVYGMAETKSPTLEQSGALENATPLAGSSPETDAVETGDAGLSESSAVHEEIVASMGQAQLANGKAIYAQLCETCHGPDGAKGLGGASDLQASGLSLNDRVNVIESGRGLMPAFSTQLTDEEVEALAAYTMTLKN